MEAEIDQAVSSGEMDERNFAKQPEDLMTEAVEQLKSKAGALTVPERADLAHFLLSSLEPDEDGAEAAWRVEIARRVAEIRSGQAVGRPADEVLAELRERFP